MKIDTKSKIAFTFASAEVSFFSQQFIKIIELLTGKLKLKNYMNSMYWKIILLKTFGMMQLKN